MPDPENDVEVLSERSAREVQATRWDCMEAPTVRIPGDVTRRVAAFKCAQ
jgi:hypothetical protein